MRFISPVPILLGIILWGMLWMSVIGGLSAGYSADTVADARLNQSERADSIGNVSINSTEHEEKTGKLPDLTDEKPANPWLKEHMEKGILIFLKTVMGFAFTIWSAVGVWTFENRGWLPPAEMLKTPIRVVAEGGIWLMLGAYLWRLKGVIYP